MLLLAFCLLWPVRRELASPLRLLAPEVLGRIALAVTFLGIYAVLLPLPHASAFVLLDRDGLIPDLFAGNLGDPMSYFDYVRRPYAPVEQWYRFQEVTIPTSTTGGPRCLRR